MKNINSETGQKIVFQTMIGKHAHGMCDTPSIDLMNVRHFPADLLPYHVRCGTLKRVWCDLYFVGTKWCDELQLHIPTTDWVEIPFTGMTNVEPCGTLWYIRRKGGLRPRNGAYMLTSSSLAGDLHSAESWDTHFRMIKEMVPEQHLSSLKKEGLAVFAVRGNAAVDLHALQFER